MAQKVELYGVIGSDWFGVTAKKFVAELRRIEADDDKDVELHINSGGGYVDDAVAMYNRLMQHPGEVTVHIDGLAASAATLVAMAGTRIVMPDNASFMIHQPWGMGVGTAAELRQSADLLDVTEDSMVTMYARRSGIAAAEIRDMLADETWLTATRAQELGFVDEVVSPGSDTVSARALAASVYVATAANDHRLCGYAHPPEWATVREVPRVDKFRAAAQLDPEDDSTELAADEPQSIPASQENHEMATETTEDLQTAASQERSRVVAIMRLAEKHNISASLRDELISEGTPVLDASSRILDALAEAQPQRSGISVQADETDKLVNGVTRALELRAGILPKDEARKERGSNPYSGRTLAELAFIFAGERGVYDRKEAVGRILASSHDWQGRHARPSADIGITHSTSDFTSILANVANKSMLLGWDQVPQTHEAWTNRGVLTDFRPTTRAGLNLFPSLLEVEEGAEYKGATLGDRGVTIQLATYGRTFGISRQMIINDDLQAMTEIPRKMGQAAARTVGNAVYAVLEANAALADGEDLFSAAHGNTHAIDINAAGISTLKAAMREQTDPGGHVLNIMPRHLIVPAEEEYNASVLLNAAFLADGGSNVLSGSLNLIVEPRLATATTIFMMADGSMHDTIEVAYLNGVEAPRLEQMDAWRVDGSEFKVGIDFGITVRDHRGMQRGT